MKTLVVVAIVLVVVTGGVVLATQFLGAEAGSNFKTAPLKRGDLTITISATGTLEPEEVIDVGAQVAGRIDRLGPDPRSETDERFQGKTVDYRSPVKEGGILALIDDSVYRATRDQAAANLDRAKADLQQLKAKRELSELDFKRAQKLRELETKPPSAPTGGGTLAGDSSKIKAISDSDYDLAKANFDMAVANVTSGEAAIKQNEASLKLAETNLGYTKIYSPVDGTIIDRRVNVGQTVVASLNAPSLFLIAKDLRKMQVWAAVNEADIGRLRLDMPVTFKVDAFTNDTFQGRVVQIRLNAQSTQNVVVYTVIVATDNADLKLMPYMTANLKFEVETRSNVLLAPNAALRWQPKPNQISPDAQKSVAVSSPKSTGGMKGGPGQRGGKGGDMASKGGGETKMALGAQPPGERGRVWVRDGVYVRPVDVQVAASDGASTEITGDEVKEDLDVVIGEMRAGSDRGGGDTTNPFAPPVFRGGRRGG